MPEVDISFPVLVIEYTLNKTYLLIFKVMGAHGRCIRPCLVYVRTRSLGHTSGVRDSVDNGIAVVFRSGSLAEDKATDFTQTCDFSSCTYPVHRPRYTNVRCHELSRVVTRPKLRIPDGRQFGLCTVHFVFYQSNADGIDLIILRWFRGKKISRSRG